MSYVLIEQNLEEEDEPRFIYAELDSGRSLLPPTRRTCGR